MKRLFKRAAALLLGLLLLLSAGCTGPDPAESDPTPRGRYESPGAAVSARGGYFLRAAVLYDGAEDAVGMNALLEALRQSTAINLEAEAVRPDAFEPECFDLVYLDESLLAGGAMKELAAKVEAFARAGGGVFCPNAFYEAFPRDFFGAQAFTPVEGYPSELHFPEQGGDFKPLQELIRDFHSVYGSYSGIEALRARGYGVGLVPAGAKALVCKYDGETALYAINRFGKGLVLFTNPLLPNRYSAASFTLETEEGQAAFANTTASCNQLIYAEFAALVSKDVYGFALSRVYGAYGSSAMSWELHYEDITAIEHDSLGQFAALAEQALQPISFTVVRNTYTWFEQAETMTYALGGGTGAPEFTLDRTESAYSSGTHIAAGERWLQLDALQGCKSYFTDQPGENYRLYPCLTDWDGDGILDAFCGSANGKLYYFRGLGFTGKDGRLCTEPAVELGVSVEAFSAPQCLDVDGNGREDLLIGASDGRVWLSRGLGGLDFAPAEPWLESGWTGQCLPRTADADGDGVPDLLLGSDQGRLLLIPGRREDGALRFARERAEDLSALCAEAELGAWLSPSLCDPDGDGAAELAVGTFPGYVALFARDSGSWRFTGWVDVADRNYKGNNHLKFGTYCSPIFTDLNGDGIQDLLCGHEEYGMAYPIDSVYFPFRAELQRQLDTAKEKHWYIGAHYLSGFWHSAEREDWELAAQKAALASYGLTELKGLNQHTWHLSQYDPRQSMEAMYRAGFLWQSGWEPSGAPYRAPESAAENTIVLPFFLVKDGQRSLLLQNIGTLGYRGTDWTDLAGKYKTPVPLYYHCDMIWKSSKSAESVIETAEAFREKFGYSFVREDQMMYASAAAANLRVNVEADGSGFTLRAEPIDTAFPLYDPVYQAACGVKITPAGAREDWDCDAEICYTENGSLYAGLNRVVRVGSGVRSDALRLRRVNVPAEITRQADGSLTLRFRSGCMAEAAVEGEASTDSEGWTVAQRGGCTVFTRFGGEGMELHLLPAP